MHSPWSELFKAMERQLATVDSREAYHSARLQHQCLLAYPGPEEAVAALHSKKLGPEKCDALLRALLCCSRLSTTREMALAALWVALRPGLLAIRRRLRFEGYHDEDVLSGTVESVERQFARFQLEAIRPITCSLLGQIEQLTERRLKARRHRFVAVDDIPEGQLARDDPDPTLLGVISSGGAPEQVEAIRARLHRLVSPVRADMVIRKCILDQSHKEIGAVYGLTPDAVRKRVQRALQTLLINFPVIERPL